MLDEQSCRPINFPELQEKDLAFLACFQKSMAYYPFFYQSCKNMAFRLVARTQALPVLNPLQRSQCSAFSSPLLPFLAPSIFARNSSGGPKGGKKKDGSARKKKERKEFQRVPVAESQKFALCDAIRFVRLIDCYSFSKKYRYLRAYEVGQSPLSRKFELAVSFRTLKNAPVIRNRMKLPNAVSSSQRIAVICPPDSPTAEQAKQAGAILVGEDSVLDAIKEERIEFNQLLCHQDSVAKLNKAGVGRILGPKGLMPSTKTKTIVNNVAAAINGMIGGTEYRERIGVVRLAIGQLGFTPEQMQANIRAFMTNLRKDIDRMSDQVGKEIHEVVSPVLVAGIWPN